MKDLKGHNIEPKPCTIVRTVWRWCVTAIGLWLLSCVLGCIFALMLLGMGYALAWVLSLLVS